MASISEAFIPDIKMAISNSQSVFSGNNYRITILSERLIRLEFNLTGQFCNGPTIMVKKRNFPVPSFKVEQDEKYIVITTKYFTLQYMKNKPFLGPKYAPDTYLKVYLNNTDKVWYYGHPEARNFKASGFSLDDFVNSKSKFINGLYSTDGFATLDDSDNLVLDTNGYVEKRNTTNNIDLYLFMYKRDFGLCLKDYYTLTGYPPLIPRYALGIWWNRDRIYSFDDTKNLLKTFNRYQIPISVLLLSEFWHIKDPQNYNLYKSGYTFNPNLFPNPEEFIKYMHERGVKIGLNIDPSEGIRKEEESYKLFANDKINPVPFNVFDKDFIFKYINNIILPLYSKGIDFLWIDYKKDLPSLQALNYYHTYLFNNDLRNRPLILSRNGLVSSHQYPICYSGETTVSWDTLKMLPNFNMLGSNLGISWWSHDVGGFKGGIEDNELYLRYVEFSCFSPIFRFSAKRGQFYKREPWLWDVKTYTIAREYCLLRHRLIPYIYSESYNYYKTGQTLIQPLYYYYPEVIDEPIYQNEYYFGKELFICPITKPMDQTMNRSIERVFLPKGIWYDFKTGKKFIGNKRYVVFYKDEDYPVFVKAGGIIPLANLGLNKNDTSVPKSMEIDIFPGSSNVYKLYEDDGVSKYYQEGYYLITAIDYNYLQNNYTLIIHPVEGKSAIIPPFRDYKIRFRNTRNADSIEMYLNGSKVALEYKAYEDDKDFVIELKNVDTTKQLTINCRGKDIEINAVRIINEDINSILNDLKIPTNIKEKIAAIIFSDLDVKKKRIEIRKIRNLDKKFMRMFIKLLEYIAEI